MKKEPISDKQFLLVQKFIDKKCKSYFKQSISEYPKGKREEVKSLEKPILELYNKILSRHIQANEFLRFVIQALVEKRKKSLVQEITYDSALEEFERRFKEIFNYNMLTLLAFGDSIKGLETEFKHKVNRADKMTGKKLTREKKKFYNSILDKQTQLKNTHPHKSQASSLTNAIKLCCKGFSDSEVKSTHSSILYHLNKGNLP